MMDRNMMQVFNPNALRNLPPEVFAASNLHGRDSDQSKSSLKRRLGSCER